MRELLARMTSEELAEWMAYEMIEPFESTRGDLRTALTCTTMANLSRTKKSDAVYQMKDFMLDFEKPLRQQQAKVTASPEAIAHAIGSGVKKGMVRMYEGDAPPIRKIGKRGKSRKKRKVLGDGKPW